MTEQTAMRFGVLGLLQVHDGAGNARPVAGARQRILLAALLVRANRVVPVAELAETVWNGAPPAGAAALRTQVMRLRRALGDKAGSRIVTRDPGYMATLTAEDLDATLFEGLHHDAGASVRAGRWREAVKTLSQALELWRGAALLDVDSQVLREEWADRLEQLRMQAVEWRVDAEMHLGRHEQLVPQLRDLARQYPLREPIHAQLMLAFYRCGRQAEALEAYEQARGVLIEELGTEPGTVLQRLHQRILTADPALAVPEPAVSVSHDPGLLMPRQLPGAVAHFAGRAAELAALTGLLDQVGERTPGMAVISAIGGTAGVGKTALAVHWAHQVAGRFPDGQLYANLRGYDPAGTPARPEEVARRFLNALGVPDSQIPSDPEACESLYRSSLAGKRVLIVLDNARDAAQVRPLLPGSSGCFVLVTSRNQLTSLAASEGARMLTVDLLSQSDAHELVARRLGHQRVRDEPEAVSELIEFCARLPIALSIAAARAAARPAFPLAYLVAELRDTDGRLDLLDAGDPGSSIRTVFSWSYQKLSAAAARMFRLLSLHAGPDISIPAAASLAGLPLDQARRAVGELTTSHLLAEHVPGRFTFHDLLRAYAADQTLAQDDEAERRAAVHRLLDHYLHAAHAAAKVLNPHRVTIMLKPAQPGVAPESAADYEQAMTWFDAERAVLLAAVDHAAGTGFDLHAWQLPAALGTFLDRRGHWGEQLNGQQIALAAAGRLGDKHAQALVHRGLAHASERLGAHEAALAHYGQALELFRELNDESGQGRARLGTGSALGRLGRYREALAHCEQGLELYRAAGDRAWQAIAFNNIGWCHAQLRQYQHALSHCEQALALHGELGDVLGAATAHDSIGYIQHHLGRYPEAAAAFHKAIAIFRKLDDQLNQADILTHLGDTYLADRKPRQALETWREALDILDDLNHPDAEHVRARLGTPSDQARAITSPDR
jgi:DNA-binding SARP family transcriptional activator